MTTTNNRSQVPVTHLSTWKIDPHGSRVEFTVRMRLLFVMKVTVGGRLSDVSGTLTVNERDPANSHVTVTIGTTSLDTKRPARDTHLRSADFFDVARYPTMTFTCQHIEALDQAAGHYRVTGTLTIREMSHEVSLDVWHVSPASTEEGRLTLTASSVLDRRDWGTHLAAPDPADCRRGPARPHRPVPPGLLRRGGGREWAAPLLNH